VDREIFESGKKKLFVVQLPQLFERWIIHYPVSVNKTNYAVIHLSNNSDLYIKKVYFIRNLEVDFF